VFVNPEEIAARGFEPGAWVDLVSHDAGKQRRAERFRLVAYPIALGSAAAYFPETNVLVPVTAVAEGSNQPASKSIVITLEPSSTPSEQPAAVNGARA
jgi:anaerobic selenocysteine-containing dehydrogenase